MKITGNIFPRQPFCVNESTPNELLLYLLGDCAIAVVGGRLF